MLQEAAALGALVLDAIRSVRLTRSNRAVIAKAVGILYRELDALVQNGDKILRILRRHNNGKETDLDRLAQLIREQLGIMDRINKTFRQRKVKTALSIHAPQLSPLQVLLEGKRARLVLLREEVGPVRGRLAEGPTLARVKRFGKIKFPSDSSIDRSRRELRKIKAQLEELRTFIVETFDVHEVL